MELFEENGYLFLKKVYSTELITHYIELIQQLWASQNLESHIYKKYDVENEYLIVNNTYSKLNNYIKQQHYYLPVVDNRYGHNRSTDAGMYDIFNIQKLIPETLEYFEVDVMSAILEKITKKKWKYHRVNLQILRNVGSPQAFHYDNHEKNIKFTLYLSEIDDDSKGAPMFIEKSHIEKRNIKQRDMHTFYGNPGDVLISYQQGYHKKTPQYNSTSYYLVFHFLEK